MTIHAEEFERIFLEVVESNGVQRNKALAMLEQLRRRISRKSIVQI